MMRLTASLVGVIVAVATSAASIASDLSAFLGSVNLLDQRSSAVFPAEAGVHFTTW